MPTPLRSQSGNLPQVTRDSHHLSPIVKDKSDILLPRKYPPNFVDLIVLDSQGVSSLRPNFKVCSQWRSMPLILYGFYLYLQGTLFLKIQGNIPEILGLLGSKDSYLML